jgi:16S rRNA (guanine(1405)-N(7))-methyltransferase
VGQVDVDEVLLLVGQMDRNAPRPICQQILRTHVSTAERLDDLEAVFEAIWAVTGQPTRVMDLACGLNPFVLPWMGPIDEYLACDIDVRLASCVGKFFENIEFNGVSVCHDLLVTVPDWEADVAFLFKALPCLEQQEKGAGLAILKQIQAPHIVVSFPTQSIGGQDKGMGAHYEGIMTHLTEALNGHIQRLVFARETYYILSRTGVL